MKKLIVIAGASLVVILLTFVSCASSPSGESVPIPTPTTPTTPRTPPTPSMAPDVGSGGMVESLPQVDEERMIVRNGDMSLVVQDVVDARDEIARLAEGQGGYVVSSWISGEEEEMRGNISIRVPDEKFEQAMAEIRELAIRVNSENTQSQDITEEFTDLEARLKNAEATESQYLALLEKASNVEETLKIYDSLARVRGEIEQIKGRMQYLERTSSMSLITAQLRPATTAKPLVSAGWSALEALKSAIRGVVIFGQWLITLVIVLLIFSPVWGTVLGIILWRRHQKKKAKIQ